MTGTVDLTDVTVRLGDVTALEAVSIQVEAGCLLGLIGPNGAGKTTLLRTITAAVTPDTGSVLVDGESVHSLSSRAVSRLVAVVPQEPAMSFAFDVREIVAMGRTPYASRFGGGDRTDAASVEAAMERTDVAAFADRPITDVSGGERQRILLARAVAQDTPVLLLDEPTASLDINHQIRTFELVRELVTDGRTVIAAIHDLGLAARYCDELAVLNEGAIVQRGTPETVLTPRTIEDVFDAAAIVTTNPVTGTPAVTAMREPLAQSSGCVHLVGIGETAVQVLYRLRAAGFAVTVGPVPAGSTIDQTARRLECPVVARSSLGSSDMQPVLARMAEASVTVLVSGGWLRDKCDLPALCASIDSLVVVDENPGPALGADIDGDRPIVATDPTDVPGAVAGIQQAVQQSESRTEPEAD